MLGRLEGQELLDGLSAVTLAASALVVARFGPASTLRARLRFVFGALCAFFASRAISGALGSIPLNLLALLIACTLPLGALLLAEGVLRRHAPAVLKVFVTAGGLATAIALIIDDGQVPAASWWLGTFESVSLACVTLLLVFRDRASLSRQENAGVDALAIPGAIVTLLTVTDFWARGPVGLSGVGVTMVAFVLGENPSSPREARGVLADLALMVLIAAVAAKVCADVLGFHALYEQVRLGAVLFAFLLATAALLRARQSEAEGAAAGFTHALCAADTSNLESFLDALAGQPLLAGLRIAEGAQLAEYDLVNLGTALATRPVWTPSTAGDDETPQMTRARQELGDLMTRNEATHAVVLSRSPLRLALLTLPGGGDSAVAETNLALFGKLAAISAGSVHASERG